MTAEPCMCGALDCRACRGSDAYDEVTCSCDGGCECDPCDEHEEGEECPKTCPTRCKCRDGCVCEPPEDDGPDPDDAYDRARDDAL